MNFTESRNDDSSSNGQMEKAPGNEPSAFIALIRRQKTLDELVVGVALDDGDLPLLFQLAYLLYDSKLHLLDLR
jgi:hypothetical protein